MTPQQQAKWEALDVRHPRKLPTGEIAGIRPMIFTVALLVGVDDIGYRTRFCFPDAVSAHAALKSWNGIGDPPGPWIKEKGRVERNNPSTLKGIPVVAL